MIAKKMVALLLVGLMAVGLFACGNSSETSEPSESVSGGTIPEDKLMEDAANNRGFTAN